MRARERKPAIPRATSAGRWPPSVSVSTPIAGPAFEPVAMELQPLRDAAGPQPVDLAAGDCAAARSAALCARLAAWYSARSSGELILPRHGYSGTSSCAASTPKWSASTEPNPVIFILPKPGRAPIRFRRSAASAASVQTRSASPPYSSATTGQSSCTRFAPSAAGSGGSRGASRKAVSRSPGSMRGDRPGVERADPLLQLERARERLLDGHLLVEREADEERERLRAR